MNAAPSARKDEETSRRGRNWTQWLAFFHGGFFLVSGIWPIVHMPSFLAVTGPKTDLWLVQTVGALIAVIGAALLFVSRRQTIEAEWKFIGAAAPLSLAAVDIIFVARDVIPPIYLADAAVELLLAAAWAASFLSGRHASA